MKIQVLSDLHNEFLYHSTCLIDNNERAIKQRSIRREISAKYEGWNPIDMISETDADVIVLAGDIDTGIRGIEWAIVEAEALSKPIIYVAGNHEFYGHEYQSLLNEMRNAASGSNVHFLENDRIVIDGVKFLGCTFWTDYMACAEFSQSETMKYVEANLNDHRRIRYGDGLFQPSDALRIHQDSRRWLGQELSNEFEGQVVVVTHHGPSRICHNKHFEYSQMSGGFWSNAEDLIEKADLWVFGHTHQCEDTTLGEARLVSNQRGYSGERVAGFLSTFIVEI